MSSKNVLGRGVGALLSDDISTAVDETFFLCDIDKIKPNPHQPRKSFDQEKLKGLAASIEEKGIIQPLLVSRAQGNRYHLIAGERRLRAAKLAGLDEVPVVVMDTDSDQKSFELALIENIQRHDLNPIEEAMAYNRLVQDFELTQEQIAKKVGRKRSTITNTLRLLNLPDFLRDDVAGGVISEGHARVLLRLKENSPLMREVRDRIVREGLSVRETERLCRKVVAMPKKRSNARAGKEAGELPESYCRALSTQLVNHLNTKVRIIQNGKRGKLEIEYYSSDDLERLLGLLINGS